MKNKFWRLGLRAVMDKACQREIMDSVAKKAKACASALAVPLMLAAAVGVVVIAAVGAGAWNHVGFFGLDKPPQVTLLRLDATERALLGSQTLWHYRRLEDALKKANASAGPSDVFLGPSEAKRFANDLKAWAGQQSVDDAQAAAELLRLARSGASWEEAAARLRSMARGPTRQERWVALEAKFKAAPRFDVGVLEVFVAFWPGDRGARDQALSAQMGPLFLVEGVVLLLFAVLVILLVVSGGMLVVGKIKAFIESHQEKLESEVEAADLNRASRPAPNGKQGPSRRL